VGSVPDLDWRKRREEFSFVYAFGNWDTLVSFVYAFVMVFFFCFFFFFFFFSFFVVFLFSKVYWMVKCTYCAPLVSKGGKGLCLLAVFLLLFFFFF
jgi:hypothetical protein